MSFSAACLAAILRDSSISFQFDLDPENTEEIAAPMLTSFLHTPMIDVRTVASGVEGRKGRKRGKKDDENKRTAQRREAALR